MIIVQPTSAQPCLLREPALPSCGHARVGAAERGFTVIELLVVMLIIAALMAIVIPKLTGARESGRTASVLAAAQSYAEAVDGFALDHTGRVPVLGSADWPVADRGPLQPIPMAGSGTLPSYLGRTVPEQVSGSSVDIVSASPAGQAAPATGQDGVIRYVAGAPNSSYRIEVWISKQDGTFPATMHCWLGTREPSGGAERCSA